jgi:hypothetical protein
VANRDLSWKLAGLQLLLSPDGPAPPLQVVVSSAVAVPACRANHRCSDVGLASAGAGPRFTGPGRYRGLLAAELLRRKTLREVSCEYLCQGNGDGVADGPHAS